MADDWRKMWNHVGDGECKEECKKTELKEIEFLHLEIGRYEF
jgi:hypothetical protein